jgi:hypothetical protein
MANNEFEIDVPEQGLARTFKKDELIAFLNEEIAFYNRIGSLVGGNLVLGNTNYGEPQLTSNAVRHLERLRQGVEKDTIDLKEYVEKARALSVVIGQGVIGKHVEALMSAGENAQAKWTMYLYSAEWMRANETPKGANGKTTSSLATMLRSFSTAASKTSACS